MCKDDISIVHIQLDRISTTIHNFESSIVIIMSGTMTASARSTILSITATHALPMGIQCQITFQCYPPNSSQQPCQNTLRGSTSSPNTSHSMTPHPIISWSFPPLDVGPICLIAANINIRSRFGRFLKAMVCEDLTLRVTWELLVKAHTCKKP